MEYQTIIQPLTLHAAYKTEVLRLDLIHSEIGGNKWFKLKYNLARARALNHTCILTFGGAHSNHIAATAAACRIMGFKCIGIIRGEVLPELNPTLLAAKEQGMQLHSISRERFTHKNEPEFIKKLKDQFGDFYVIPEGGNNVEGLLGCTHILKSGWRYDYVFCACGTATTFAGLVASASNSKIIGISVLKGENNLPQRTHELFKELNQGNKFVVLGNAALDESLLTNHAISNAYCFSGYAKYDSELTAYKQQFENKHKIPLDYIYTAKLFYAVESILNKNCIPEGSNVLVIHSGGLQGNQGFETRYHLKTKAVSNAVPAMKFFRINEG